MEEMLAIDVTKTLELSINVKIKRTKGEEVY